MKLSRQTKIVEIIRKYNVETQEELVEYLQSAGFIVTQATISRDIKELRLTKIPTEDGRFKYAFHQGDDTVKNEKFVRVFRDAFVSMEKAQNILVIKTVSGMAMAAAAALDSLEIEGMVGCIAGDDTIMCAIRTSEETNDVMKELEELIYCNSSAI